MSPLLIMTIRARQRQSSRPELLGVVRHPSNSLASRRGQNSRRSPGTSLGKQQQRSLPSKSCPVKVVVIKWSPCEAGHKAWGYRVTGTTLGGEEVCDLKVTTPSSFLLSDLYKVIDKSTDGDLCLVTSDGGILPGRNQVVTLADALTGRHDSEPLDDEALFLKERKIEDDKALLQKPIPNNCGAFLCKKFGSFSLKARKTLQ